FRSFGSRVDSQCRIPDVLKLPFFNQLLAALPPRFASLSSCCVFGWQCACSHSFAENRPSSSSIALSRIPNSLPLGSLRFAPSVRALDRRAALLICSSCCSSINCLLLSLLGSLRFLLAACFACCSRVHNLSLKFVHHPLH